MSNYSNLIGVPFAYGGRGPDKYDCYGLLRKLYADRGISLPDYKSPTDGALITAMMAGQLHLWRELSDPVEGAAMLIKVPGNMHTGMYIGDGRFIHTWEKSGGVVIERIHDWKSILGYYEYVG